MDYQILVLDLDGTLTNSKKEITQPTLEALIEIQEAGKKVVLASGRPTQGVMPLAEQLHLEDYGSYILSFNGGRITDCRTKRQSTTRFFLLIVFRESTKRSENTPARGLMS